MRAIAIVLAGAFVLACSSEPDAVNDEVVPAAIEPEPTPVAEPTTGNPPGSAASPERPATRAPEPASEAIEIRIARQTLIVHAAPDEESAIRGRIAMSEAFEIFAFVPGPA